MFSYEASNWLANDSLTEAWAIPGLSPNYPYVYCKPPQVQNSLDRDECLITTDECYANAATSMMALVWSGVFDLTKTYFIVAGIAGVDPIDGTLGSAAWARYVVDYGLSYELDAREMPPTWPYGYTGFGPVPPGVYPTILIGTEVYRLNEALLQKALALTSHLDLTVFDNPTAQAYRALYTNHAAAREPPSVLQCDSVAIDTWWHGYYLSERASNWTTLLTNGSGNYCMTNEEDSATMTALRRAHLAGRVDFTRVAVLRTASNFDQEYPGQTAWESLNANSGGFEPSLDSAYYVGSTLAHDIVKNWETVYERGLPDSSTAVW